MAGENDVKSRAMTNLMVPKSGKIVICSDRLLLLGLNHNVILGTRARIADRSRSIL